MPAPKDLTKKEIWKERLSTSHKGIIPWNKGKHLSEETKRKLSKISKEFWINSKNKEKIETRNKKISKALKGERNPMKRLEVRMKASEGMRGRLMGNKNPARRPKIRRKISEALKGHTVSPEVRKKIAKSLNGRYVGKLNPFYGKHHAKEVKEKSRARAINQLISGELRNRSTSIELKMERELRERNIFYKKQFPLLNRTVVDFYLPRYKVAIYCDGTFWHTSEWAAREGVIEKDKKQTRILSANGYKVFRFSEMEINNLSEMCIDKITEYINKT